MTITKGRTNCQSERDLVLQGFSEQLQILENSQIEQENVFKARLYDIITDYSISEDEKSSLKYPWSNELQELEERHIRIRRSVLIGLYSFWEVSLMEIVRSIIPNYIEELKIISKKTRNFGARDYVKLIYGANAPKSIELINYNICELRNYMVHGSMNESRKSLIDELRRLHPEFCIVSQCKESYICSYNGLKALLGLLSKELEAAETKISKIKNSNIK